MLAILTPFKYSDRRSKETEKENAESLLNLWVNYRVGCSIAPTKKKKKLATLSVLLRTLILNLSLPVFSSTPTQLPYFIEFFYFFF